MGVSKVGTIVEVVEHMMSGQVHQSVKIKSDGFAAVVSINLTLFPRRVRLIEEKDSE
jgi:hypothetical protein